ncbi:unnamed protein product, partial [Allacma fusca]
MPATYSKSKLEARKSCSTTSVPIVRHFSAFSDSNKIYNPNLFVPSDCPSICRDVIIDMPDEPTDPPVIPPPARAKKKARFKDEIPRSLPQVD